EPGLLRLFARQTRQPDLATNLGAAHWTPRGAHLLLQIRTRVLNNELEDLFRQWYPAFRNAV
ncbi:hypothetical protein, partial [Deinococcus arenae]|uniref:hypothetical protein n=1 Tax=Deinococcus arenae TaxID=1452751 RepID=UPI001E6191C2